MFSALGSSVVFSSAFGCLESEAMARESSPDGGMPPEGGGEGGGEGDFVRWEEAERSEAGGLVTSEATEETEDWREDSEERYE